MAIIITPEDLNPAPGIPEDKVTEAITVAIAYAELLAPCIGSLEGSRALVAKALIVQAINSNFSPGSSSTEKIGPFTIEGKVQNGYFPDGIAQQLQALCGKKSGLTLLEINNRFYRRGCEDYIWLVDRVEFDDED